MGTQVTKETKETMVTKEPPRMGASIALLASTRESVDKASSLLNQGDGSLEPVAKYRSARITAT